MIGSIKQMLRGTFIYVFYKNLEAKLFEINPRNFINDRYKHFYGVNINFSSPQKLSEKMQLLKIYHYP